MTTTNIREGRLLSTPVFELSIEPVGAPTYRDGFHLGTDEVIARRLAVEAFHQRKPRNGTAIRSVALFREGKMVDCYDGHWASDLHEIFEDAAPDQVVAQPGSISHGTLRHEDLLGTFAGVLLNLARLPSGEAHIALAHDAEALADRLASDQPFESDEAPELISDLFDALETYSPAGHHFGAHEGDGSDFGWWPNEEEEDPVFASDTVREANRRESGREMFGWEEREAEATAEVYVDRGATLFDALSLPEGERRKIAEALANQTILFRS